MAKRSFHQELVLNHWMMGFFKGGTLHALKNRLGEDRHEGIDEDGQTGFFHELHQNLFEVDRISEQELRRYDLNIVQHWNAITEQRNKVEGTVLNMKYFQYLSLLFTEIYLDWYFNRRQQLLDGLNEGMQAYNADLEAEHHFQPFDADELNKLAFWNATGSGKTLLLHVNIRQYLHYFQNGKKDAFPDKIILLTPNEGLSRQHLDELQLSGFGFCRLFDKNRSGVFKGTIEIIDINKLGDEMGDKTVAVEAFEGNNLVLVDEGHRGTGTAAGAWMSRREALVRGGFAFEYSATFGQAVAKGLTVLKAEEETRKKKARVLFETTNLRRLNEAQLQQLTLTSEEKRKARTMATREIYAKCILFDYSYKFFYEDGYGKESLILNLKDEDYTQEDTARQYFTACLLSFYQQQYLWNTSRDKLTDFNLEKPLWVFVGNTVSGEDSDILNVLKFLAGFLNDEGKTKQWLKDLLANTARLLDAKSRNIFHDRFTPLIEFSADEVYADILKKLFNSSARQRLKVINLKSSKGELALRVGEAEPFGLINIGDDAGFFKEAEKPENLELFDTEADDFGGSMFGTLNNKDSQLHVLIGSRKFTEGWSSWRVSTMGLLNMGKGEGSQIIQLFGRGVRLKGMGMSLKRSAAPGGPHLHHPPHIGILETLNIFAVRADYMAQFRDYLEREGVETEPVVELPLFTWINEPALRKELVIPRTPERIDFVAKKRLALETDANIKVNVDMSVKVQVMTSTATGLQEMQAQAGKRLQIPQESMALVDWGQLYLALLAYKTRKGWRNLIVRPETPRQLFRRIPYTLVADEAVVRPRTFCRTLSIARGSDQHFAGVHGHLLSALPGTVGDADDGIPQAGCGRPEPRLQLRPGE